MKGKHKHHRNRNRPPPWRGPEHHPETPRQSACGCRSPSVSYYRTPGGRVAAVCLSCHRSALPPGRTLPPEAVVDPAGLPPLPEEFRQKGGTHGHE
jgi:hypothetical protein